MNKRRFIFLWVVIILLSMSGCNSRAYPQSSPTSISTTQAEDQKAPIAIVQIDRQVLKFWCPDKTNCLPDISLENEVLLKSPFELGPIFYWDPTNVYAILFLQGPGSTQGVVLHINPQTGEKKLIALPGELHNINFLLVGGRLAAVDDGGKKLFFIQKDLTISSTEVDFPINKIIATSDYKVIALNQQPIVKNGMVYIEVSVIDSESDNFTESSFPLPFLKLPQSKSTPDVANNYLVEVEGISRNLDNLYCLYYSGAEPNILRLGTFNIKSGKVDGETQDKGLIKLTSGYAQYHEMLYTSNFGGSEGSGAGASLIQMSSMTSLLDFEHQLDLRSSKLIVDPFGESFLIGTANQIILLSSDGQFLNKFPLPDDWANKDYHMVYYEK